jgi:HPt (histidine-containing phosphotransfer) domain-containing protein
MKAALGTKGDCKGRKSVKCAFVHRTIDLAHLARYTKGNSAVERELLVRFQKKAKSYFKTMSAAKDNGVWKEAALQLQSAASTAGAWRILATAQQASNLHKEANSPERAQLLARLDEEISEANAFIRGVM